MMKYFPIPMNSGIEKLKYFWIYWPIWKRWGFEMLIHFWKYWPMFHSEKSKLMGLMKYWLTLKRWDSGWLIYSLTPKHSGIETLIYLLKSKVMSHLEKSKSLGWPKSMPKYSPTQKRWDFGMPKCF